MNILKNKSLLIIIIGIILTILINIFNLDIYIQNLFWNNIQEEWKGNQSHFIKGFYAYSTMPAIVISVLSMLLLILSYSFKRLIPFRKIFAYFFLLLAIGNGLIVNGILKEFWGRPRPAQLVNYANTQTFEPCLIIDKNSYGKSFPCGHATMGFYFFALGLLFKRKWRYSIITFSILFGSIIGIIRSSMGGHFLSDTLWAGIIIWVIAKSLYLKLNLHKNIYYEELPAKSKKELFLRKLIQYSLIPLFLILITGLTLSTPRNKVHTLDLTYIDSKDVILDLDLLGVLNIKTNEENFTFITKSSGFGFPKTKLISVINKKNDTKYEISHQVLGLFSELNAQSILYLPKEIKFNLKFDKRVPDEIYLNGILKEVQKSLIIEN